MVRILTLYRASDHIQSLPQCQCFQAYQITDQSGDAILDCSTDQPIRCRVSFDIKTIKFTMNERMLYFH